MWSDTPCKIWTGWKNSYGYPLIWRDGKTLKLCRVVLEEKLGRPIGKKMQACHHCDNRACYESEHLWEGTNNQNQQDALNKGKKVRFIRG